MEQLQKILVNGLELLGNLVKKLGLIAGMRVADICCGKGRHSIELSNYELSVWGMDLSQNSINEARKLGNERTSFDVHDMRESFLNPDLLNSTSIAH